ncbi:hypothetical protein MTR67_002836 [Solanum verrucosum]|uniref:Uncharacterized protein n=1 Tax=Solanum verrucosum TaxID=315347 RepID=A0AAF0PRL3_SOLVR|nr:hypothetical protein MTR67_002836 [Solanum verrucosum]
MLRRAIRRSKLGSPINSAIRPFVNSIAFLPWPLASFRSVTLGDLTLHQGTIRRSANCSFILPT